MKRTYLLSFFLFLPFSLAGMNEEDANPLDPFPINEFEVSENSAFTKYIEKSGNSENPNKKKLKANKSIKKKEKKSKYHNINIKKTNSNFSPDLFEYKDESLSVCKECGVNVLSPFIQYHFCNPQNKPQETTKKKKKSYNEKTNPNFSPDLFEYKDESTFVCKECGVTVLTPYIQYHFCKK